MNRSIVQLTIVVRDYDEAINFYTTLLDFELIEDTPLSDVKRWVVVKPRGTGGGALLLAKAATDEQRKAIGHQSGGRVFLFMHTDDCRRDYNLLSSRGISFLREPADEPYGTVAVFKDLYGNLWDLIQPRI